MSILNKFEILFDLLMKSRPTIFIWLKRNHTKINFM